MRIVAEERPGSVTGQILAQGIIIEELLYLLRHAEPHVTDCLLRESIHQMFGKLKGRPLDS